MVHAGLRLVVVHHGVVHRVSDRSHRRKGVTQWDTCVVGVARQRGGCQLGDVRVDVAIQVGPRCRRI